MFGFGKKSSEPRVMIRRSGSDSYVCDYAKGGIRKVSNSRAEKMEAAYRRNGRKVVKVKR